MKKNVFLPTYAGCIVCGNRETNPNTLNVRFKVTEAGVVVPFKADYKQEGYKGIVHGGIITSLLDETIGWAIAVKTKKYFMTAEITVRFVRSLPTDKEVTVQGRVLEIKSRYSIGEGEIIDAEGIVYAKAQGKFVPMNEEAARSVHKYLKFLPEDMDILKE